MGRAWLAPMTYWADAAAKMYSSHGSWLSGVPNAPRIAAGYELLYRLGKDYSKPEFRIKSVRIDEREYPVVEREELRKPFCRLLRFKRYSDELAGVGELKDDPVVLVVAPLSGHHATLLRDTVRTLLRGHKVYITDWTDARMVPLSEGPFHLNDYVRYVQDFIRHLGPDVHVISVCQPTVPVLAARRPGPGRSLAAGALLSVALLHVAGTTAVAGVPAAVAPPTRTAPARRATAAPTAATPDADPTTTDARPLTPRRILGGSPVG